MNSTAFVHKEPMDTERIKAEGWVALTADVFSRLAGPFWIKGDRGARTIGLLAEERHTNGHLGIVHGGVLMTFADVALGCAAVDVIGEPRCVTAQLQLQFVAAGRVGELITCQPELVRATSQLIFLRGLILANDRVVASTDGVWKILEPRAA